MQIMKELSVVNDKLRRAAWGCFIVLTFQMEVTCYLANLVIGTKFATFLSERQNFPHAVELY